MVSIPVPRNSILLFYLLFAFLVSSQNQIKNPSFERFDNCPKRLGNFGTDVVSWSTPTDGSTDYFNACSTSMGTPENFNGKQPAEFGEGYAGFYLYAPDDYREYLQAELIRTLENGRAYQVSFYISLAERSDFAIKEFGVLFTKDQLAIPIKKELSKSHLFRQNGNVYTYLEIGTTNFYSDTQDWIPVSTRFVAKGTEKYMVLGNFKNNARTRKFKTEYTAKQGAYYYVDMVEVKAAEAADTASDENSFENIDKQKGSFTLDKTHVFENVLFEFDHSEVLETAKDEIQRIFDYLKANPDLHIAINGHTDSLGTDDYNQQLAGKRAKRVADYLMQMGIPQKRIVWQGHGGEIPIATNASEEGRKRNRRVEFVISNPNTP
ncbi:OmpA family protein [Pricia sp.]|uniref:OmpA family protein n=1 Tax=Pricia sp. TaxID=2268138 RepID=UPI0035938206